MPKVADKPRPKTPVLVLEQVRERLRPGGDWVELRGTIRSSRHEDQSVDLTLRLAVDAPRRRTIAVGVPRHTWRDSSGNTRVSKSHGYDERLVRLDFPGIVYYHVGTTQPGYTTDQLQLFGYLREFNFDNSRLHYLGMPNGCCPVCFTDPSVLRRMDPREAYWNTSFGNDDLSTDVDAMLSGQQPLIRQNSDTGLTTARFVEGQAERYGTALSYLRMDSHTDQLTAS